jgi:hypothetical protein
MPNGRLSATLSISVGLSVDSLTEDKDTACRNSVSISVGPLSISVS